MNEDKLKQEREQLEQDKKVFEEKSKEAKAMLCDKAEELDQREKDVEQREKEVEHNVVVIEQREKEVQKLVANVATQKNTIIVLGNKSNLLQQGRWNKYIILFVCVCVLVCLWILVAIKDKMNQQALIDSRFLTAMETNNNIGDQRQTVEAINEGMKPVIEQLKPVIKQLGELSKQLNKQQPDNTAELRSLENALKSMTEQLYKLTTAQQHNISVITSTANEAATIAPKSVEKTDDQKKKDDWNEIFKR